MINPEIENKAAIITGANAGIGASIARALASQGVKVIVHNLDGKHSESDTDSDYSIEHSLEGEKSAVEIVDSINNSGGTATCISGDLNNKGVITKLFDFAEKKFGPVEILVNNAARGELPDTIKKSTRGVQYSWRRIKPNGLQGRLLFQVVMPSKRIITAISCGPVLVCFFKTYHRLQMW